MTEMKRLSDKIIAAHTQACETGKLEVAKLLLEALEVDLSAIGGSHPEHRKATEMIEAAYERQMNLESS